MRAHPIDYFNGLHLLGYLIFLLFATFNVSFAWDVVYFIWEVLGQTSVGACVIILLIGNTEVRQKTFPILLLCLFRLAWEIVAAKWDLDINNEFGVLVLFLVAIGITSYLAFRPSGFLPKWLDTQLKSLNL